MIFKHLLGRSQEESWRSAKNAVSMQSAPLPSPVERGEGGEAKKIFPFPLFPLPFPLHFFSLLCI